MSAFLDEIELELRSRIVIAFWATISLFLAVTGPYGTYVTYTMPERFVVCIPVMATLLLLGVVIRVGLRRIFGAHGWLVMVMTAAAAIVVLAPLADLLLHLVIPPEAMNYPGLAELSLLIGSMSVGYSALRRTVSGGMERVAPVENAARTDNAARIMQRVDPHLRGDLLAISVQDHYVDVYTSAGKARVLLRLSDAIAEASPVDGAQVHRSHWVAWQAVAAVEREGAKMFLRLAHGVRVPVSKNHRDKVEQRGFP